MKLFETENTPAYQKFEKSFGPNFSVLESEDYNNMVNHFHAHGLADTRDETFEILDDLLDGEEVETESLNKFRDILAKLGHDITPTSSEDSVEVIKQDEDEVGMVTRWVDKVYYDCVAFRKEVETTLKLAKQKYKLSI